MSKVNKILQKTFCISLIIALLMVTIDYFCFSKKFYIKEYEKLQLHETIGVRQEDVSEMTFTLLDYMKNKREDIVLFTNVNGEYREVYNQREKIHMVDVKNLYLFAIRVEIVSFLLSIVSLLTLLIKKGLKGIYYTYLKVLALFGTFFSCIGLMCVIDFNSFWISFHEVLFNNDYWLLDPRESLMINILPEQLFFDLVIRIVLAIIVLIVVLLFIFKKLERRLLND